MKKSQKSVFQGWAYHPILADLNLCQVEVKSTVPQTFLKKIIPNVIIPLGNRKYNPTKKNPENSVTEGSLKALFTARWAGYRFRKI
jgi:hypothetical protein